MKFNTLKDLVSYINKEYPWLTDHDGFTRDDIDYNINEILDITITYDENFTSFIFDTSTYNIHILVEDKPNLLFMYTGYHSPFNIY